MKKLLVAVLLVVGLATYAQEAKMDSKNQQIAKLSPEERDQLHLKKLTLELGLNEKQQKEIGAIITEQSAKRKAAAEQRKIDREKGATITTEERTAKKSQKLDDEIALQQKVRTILTPDQFTKWEKMQQERKDKMRNRTDRKAEKVSKSEE